jgi:isopropylmalate/homocitrate/citramalate synthase
MVVENWSLGELLEQLDDAATLARSLGLEYRIAFEDSTRAFPEDLADALNVAMGTKTTCVVLNDTAGASLPDGAYSHVNFARRRLEESAPKTSLMWHGHGDQGLALANALAAVEGGASIISGTVLGIGERCGNIPLEQAMALAAAVGAPSIEPRALPDLCAQFAAAVGVAIPVNAPLVGADAFSTATGTHAAAVLKAMALGSEWADAVYSGVSAAVLGREQTLLIGPNSGRAAVRNALANVGLSVEQRVVDAVLTYCRERRVVLRSEAELEQVVRL